MFVTPDYKGSIFFGLYLRRADESSLKSLVDRPNHVFLRHLKTVIKLKNDNKNKNNEVPA